MKAVFIIVVTNVLLVACAIGKEYNPLDDYKEVDAATNLDMPTPSEVPEGQREEIKRGEYLVELLGCGSCHTDGALVGKPDMGRLLAGSSVGIAYTSPFENEHPAVVFPRNLTPDPDTGLGNWTAAQIAAAIRAGAGQHGARRIMVMPWQHYANITEEDVAAMVSYLRNLEPVKHQVPAAVAKGTATSNVYVHFGIYLSREF